MSSSRRTTRGGADEADESASLLRNASSSSGHHPQQQLHAANSGSSGYRSTFRNTNVAGGGLPSSPTPSPHPQQMPRALPRRVLSSSRRNNSSGAEPIDGRVETSCDAPGGHHETGAPTAASASHGARLEKEEIGGGDGADQDTLTMDVEGMSLSFRDVVLMHRAEPFLKPWAKPTLVLQQACGFFEAGSCNAIGGISTEYTTALLSVLSGGTLPTTGHILANGVPVAASSFRKIVGYVGRTPAVFPELSVERNLRFSINMRSRHTVHEDNVTIVMQMFGLHGDTKVAKLDSTDKIKLEIAMELVLDPTVLFLEDPLDGVAAHEVAELAEILYRISRVLKKTVVFTVSHFPMPVFERVDNLVLLGFEGHTLYSGPRKRLMGYYLSLRLSPNVMGAGGVHVSSSYSNLDSSSPDFSPRFEGEEGSNNNHNQSSILSGGVVVAGGWSPWRRQTTDSTFSHRSMDSAEEVKKSEGDHDHNDHRSVVVATTATTATEVSKDTVSKGNSPSRVNFDTSQNVAEGEKRHRRHDSAGGSQLFNSKWFVVPDADTALDLAELWADTEKSHHSTTRYAAAFYDSKDRYRLMKRMEDPLLNGTLSPWGHQVIGGGGEPSPGSTSSAPTSPATRVNCVKQAIIIEEETDDGGGDEGAMIRRTQELRSSQNFNFARLIHQQPGAFSRFFGLLSVHFQKGLRKKELYFSFAILFFVFLFAAFLMNRQSQSQQGMQNIRGILFFMFWVFLELNIYFIDSLLDDVRLLLNHRDGGYYTVPLYMLVMSLRLAVQRIVMLVPLALFIYFVLNSMNQILWLLGLCSFVHVMLVMLVVSLLMNARMATFVGIVIDAYFVIFSGFLINLKTVPVAVAKTSLIRFGYGGAVELELENRPLACDASALVTNSTNATSYCYTGNEYLESQDFGDDTVGGNSGQLLIIAAVLMFLVTVRLYTMRLR